MNRNVLRPALTLGSLSAVACVSCNLFRRDVDVVALGASWRVSDTTYFHQGIAAGPVLTTNASGGVLEERRYEPFGQPIDARHGANPAGNVDFRLESQNILGKQSDPNTGWSYHGARWMAPQTARWLTPDSALKGASNLKAPWDLNPYKYSSQSPTTLWDPDGQWPRGFFPPTERTRDPTVNVQVQLSRDLDKSRGSQTDFPWKLNVYGVPKDGSLRWEQLVSGSFTIHSLGNVNTTHEARDLVNSNSKQRGGWWDDITGEMTRGPRAIDPKKYPFVTNVDGHYTATDDPGATFRFDPRDETGKLINGASAKDEKGRFVTGVTFNLRFQQRLSRDGDSEPFLTVQFFVVGRRDANGLDTRRIIMVPTNYDGPDPVEPLR